MPLELLSFAERRVLGVLIEKGFTTPEQYPLSLNSVVTGSNQKSCRDPLSSLDEEAALDSLESLRRKGLATLVRMEGSRVDRWKHRAGDTLGLEAKEVALLGELLLRGPQTDGELRQRASRMVPIETLEELGNLIEGLQSRAEPLIERITPPGRKRGVKYAHTLYPASERPRDDRAEADEGLADTDAAPWSPAAAPSSLRASLRASSGASVEASGRAPSRDPVGAPIRAPDRDSSSAPPAVAPPLPAPPPRAPAVVDGALEELKKEIGALKERIEELEATFVKFLR
jgi:hypothetical protein